MPIPEGQIFILDGTLVHRSAPCLHTRTEKQNNYYYYYYLTFVIFATYIKKRHFKRNGECVFPLLPIINILKINLKTSESQAVLETETFTCYIIIYSDKFFYCYLSP